MAFDGVFLSLILRELAPVLVGARVDKIYQPAKNLLVLQMRSKEFAGKLMLSAEPGGARLQLTRSEMENPATPPMLCMLLRKKLVGAKLTALRQPGWERLVYLDFSTKNELGDPICLTLIAELMGRNANLILCSQDGRIIDAVRRTDAADTARIIMPGVTYLPPVRENDFYLPQEEPQAVLAALAGCAKRNLAKQLVSAVPGISPLVARELAFRVLPLEDSAPDEPLTPLQQEALLGQLQNLKQWVLQGGQPTLMTDATGKPIEYTFFSPQQYGDQATAEHCESYSQLLDRFYARREQKARMQAKSQSLTKFLHTAIARLARTINVRTAELEEARNCEQLRIYGELLKANLHAVKPGDTLCRVMNYYDPECAMIDLPLSPALSPAQNAQRFFKEYRKKRTAAGMLEGLIAKSQADLTYLSSVEEALSRAGSTAEIAAIQEELQESGFLKAKNGKSKKSSSVKALPPLEFVSEDGFLILAGRNNRQNDRLTLRESAGSDIWFHTKNIPGAHVIVKSQNQPVPNATLTQAAKIAATLSGGAQSTGVAVDYCPVKRVKKPSGAAPGMVIYENYQTAYVDPDPQLLEQLRKS